MASSKGLVARWMGAAGHSGGRAEEGRPATPGPLGPAAHLGAGP